MIFAFSFNESNTDWLGSMKSRLFLRCVAEIIPLLPDNTLCANMEIGLTGNIFRKCLYDFICQFFQKIAPKQKPLRLFTHNFGAIGKSKILRFETLLWQFLIWIFKHLDLIYKCLVEKKNVFFLENSILYATLECWF